jgi:hypothetical protein
MSKDVAGWKLVVDEFGDRGMAVSSTKGATEQTSTGKVKGSIYWCMGPLTVLRNELGQRLVMHLETDPEWR